MPVKKVGWFIEENIPATFIFPEPKPVKNSREAPLSNRAVQACPAVNEYERDLYVLKSAFDLRLRCIKRQDAFDLHVVDDGTRIDEDLVARFVFLMKPDLWRQSDKPVIQLRLPYFFLSDKPCFMTQTAPHMSQSILKWPGLMISGRFPINIWPRILNWAFEWHDLEKDVVIRRNDPLCYLYFETEHLRSNPNLFEIENTPELQEYRAGLAAVPKFMSNTFSLFETALERRPKELLRRKNCE